MENWFEEMEQAEQEYDAKLQDESRAYEKGYQQGRADAIDELRPFIHKNYKDQKFIFVCAEDFKNLDLWKQLKENKNDD